MLTGHGAVQSVVVPSCLDFEVAGGSVVHYVPTQGMIHLA